MLRVVEAAAQSTATYQSPVNLCQPLPAWWDAPRLVAAPPHCLTHSLITHSLSRFSSWLLDARQSRLNTGGHLYEHEYEHEHEYEYEEFAVSTSSVGAALPQEAVAVAVTSAASAPVAVPVPPSAVLSAVCCRQ